MLNEFQLKKDFSHMILSDRVQDKICQLWHMSAWHKTFLLDNVQCPTAISIPATK